ncbi:MAG: hypothetical protein R2711_02625 [Acidimicrobiales bacterium]
MAGDDPTGTALIVVDDAGANTVVTVFPGANWALPSHLVERHDVVVAQLEVPERGGRRRFRPGAAKAHRAQPVTGRGRRAPARFGRRAGGQRGRGRCWSASPWPTSSGDPVGAA